MKHDEEFFERLRADFFAYLEDLEHKTGVEFDLEDAWYSLRGHMVIDDESETPETPFDLGHLRIVE